jgi:hypothetical protein
VIHLIKMAAYTVETTMYALAHFVKNIKDFNLVQAVPTLITDIIVDIICAPAVVVIRMREDITGIACFSSSPEEIGSAFKKLQVEKAQVELSHLKKKWQEIFPQSAPRNRP